MGVIALLKMNHWLLEKLDIPINFTSNKTQEKILKFQKSIKNKVQTCLQTINWEMSEKKINNQNSFLWKMVFTIKFYTFYNVGNNL
jgi:hypothetical protein